MDNGPWTHNSNPLVLHELKKGEQPREVPLVYADFWIQVYDLPFGFFVKAVGEALGGFIGMFFDYDETTYGTGSNQYMRVRVRMDVRKPLKREKKIKRPGEQPVTCSFKYEKLPTFCFICGVIGHVERNCEIRFR